MLCWKSVPLQNGNKFYVLCGWTYVAIDDIRWCYQLDLLAIADVHLPDAIVTVADDQMICSLCVEGQTQWATA